MSKIEKLKARLARKPKDFSFDELCTLLRACGFELEAGGKTGGSRRKFINAGTGTVIFLHEPHPNGKTYQINEILNVLRGEGWL